MILYIKRLTGTAKSPVYGTKDSAGMDLHADAPITIQQGDRFAQMVIVPFVQPQIEDAAELSATARGIGGFGSTGV